MSGNTESELPAAGGWPGLAVKNFGPIADGKVELRPLTVFAGPSNTGKSWLATLIYAFARHVNGDSGLPERIDPDDNALENFPEDPAAWLRTLQKDKTLRLTDGDKQALKSFLENGQDALKEELLRCFGLVDVRHLVREGDTGAANITFGNTASTAFATRQRLTVTGEDGFSLGVDVMTAECRPPSTKRLIHLLERFLGMESDDERYKKSHLRYLRASLLNYLAYNSWYLSAYYLPADRGGVMHAHRVVVGALIQSASRAGLTHRSPLPTLSGVLGDFLEQLIELAGRRPKRLSSEGPSAESADILERKVLGGKIKVKKSELGYPHFTYRPAGWKHDLSLMSVSSMVSELAPVALYLRHCVGKGDLLILEEPEAHLHPAMQVRLVREIAGWVRRGVKVLITTHSEWVMEEIANLVAAGESEKEDGLKKQDVGMWLFEPNGTKTPGSRIKEIEWSVDEGGFAIDFDDVAMALHNKWAGLVRNIQ